MELFIVFDCPNRHVSVVRMCTGVSVPTTARRQHWVPVHGLTSTFEPPDMDIRNRTESLYILLMAEHPL